MNTHHLRARDAGQQLSDRLAGEIVHGDRQAVDRRSDTACRNHGGGVHGKSVV